MKSLLDMTQPLLSCSEYRQLQIKPREWVSATPVIGLGNGVAEWIQTRHIVYKHKIVKEQTKEILKVVKGLQSTSTCSADMGKDVTVYHELNAS